MNFSSIKCFVNVLGLLQLYRKSIIRIINGVTAPNKRYSFSQVSLSMKNEHQCGGSIVAPDLILSAAHCRSWFDSISINRYNFSSTDRHEKYEVFQSMDVMIHPSFDPITFRNDFMLIQLDGTTTTTPIRMNNNSSIPSNGMNLTVLGWGITNNSDPMNLIFPTLLQKGSIRYITNEQCTSTIIQNKSLYAGEIFPEMMCADSVLTGIQKVDACAGDSGGPLVIEEATDLLVGLVSWGRGCAIYPGVYSRISAEYNWLREQICFISINPPLYLSCTNSERNPKYRVAQATLSPTTSYVNRVPFETRSPTSTKMQTIELVPSTINTVQIEIQLDTKSNETSWAIYSSQGIQLVNRPQGTYTNTPSTLISEQIQLPAEKTFSFVIGDENGDGICCSAVNRGWFRISLKHVVLNGDANITTVVPLVVGNGEFGYSSQHSFETNYAGTTGTSSPTMTPTEIFRQPAMSSREETSNRFDKFDPSLNFNPAKQNVAVDSIRSNANVDALSEQQSSSSYLFHYKSFSSIITHCISIIVIWTISMPDY
jgi:Trypsin